MIYLSSITTFIVLVAASSLHAQDPSTRCAPSGQAAKPKPKPWAGYNQGVRWEKSLDEAKKRAAKEGKPILFHQLVGAMDKEGC